ncbi:MAG: asparagine synthase [Dehalococcoidia bacterium]|nr:MAG: asparagine synthase [Dehalococcoidia bacterium]
MAGIAGIRTSGADLEGMLQRLKHRGPRETWLSPEQYLRLGCCLLPSEMMPKPRAYACQGARVAVLDGHVYHAESGQSADAELMLSLYERNGPRFVEALDGDFACAIADGDELILTRDAVGLRPLYYSHQDGGFLFASEAKALCPVADDIKEFPPRHVYTSADGLRSYTPRPEETPDFDTPEQATQILAELLERAVERRMADGVPEGVLLSGGLDSSIIACLAKEYRPDLKTFTVSLGDGEDREHAQEVARYLGTEHHEYTYTEREIIEVLPQVIYYLESFEEDCVSGAVANYFASRLAAGHIGCVLTGEGSDEFLGGYHELKTAKDEAELQRMMDRLIAVAYNTGLQRLDRMMAAHSLEFRTPFLDRAVTDFCLKIPAKWKVYGPEQVEKWILRRAFSGRLPEHIVWRIKRPFAAGAGSSAIMGPLAEKLVSGSDFMGHRQTEEGLRLNSAEELYYYRIFKGSFPQPTLSRLVARWDPAKGEFRS